MSSPTKIEYLAAGLHIIGLEGIAALDRLAAQSTCVDVISRDEHDSHLSEQEAHDFVSRVKSSGRSDQARILAKKFYDRSQAVAKYLDLYQKVLSSG